MRAEGVAAKCDQARYSAIQGIRIATASGAYRAEATDGRNALVVQGIIHIEDSPWPGFKELPDDACEVIVLPKDLGQASSWGQLDAELDTLDMATSGNDIHLGRILHPARAESTARSMHDRTFMEVRVSRTDFDPERDATPKPQPFASTPQRQVDQTPHSKMGQIGGGSKSISLCISVLMAGAEKARRLHSHSRS